MPNTLSKNKLKGNALVVKHRSKKEQRDMAGIEMRQATREATPKMFNLLDKKTRQKKQSRKAAISKNR